MPGDIAVNCLIYSRSPRYYPANINDIIDLLTILCFCFCVMQLIDGEILCVHGGLSPSIRTLDQIRTIERNQEIPHKGAFCDLVWSDPEDVETWTISPRGAGWLFGSRVTHEFMHLNGLELICRAHQLVHEGYKFMFDDKLVTVASSRLLWPHLGS